MITNFFLTGPLHIGKSTILRETLNLLKPEVIGGFRTVPIFQNGQKSGFRLVAPGGNEKVFAHTDFATPEQFSEFYYDKKIFDTFGVSILDNSLLGSQIIVMDEIGMMEREARLFHDAIVRCLNSDVVVLGVFQERAQWFEALLKDRTDTKIYRVSVQNRDTIKTLFYRDINERFISPK